MTGFVDASTGNPPTRAAETEQAYRLRAQQLLGSCARDRGVESPETLNDDEMVGWCEEKAVEVRPASWRTYRASLSWWAEEQGRGELAERIRGVASVEPDKGKAMPQRTSARKLKGGRDDLADLLDHLHAKTKTARVQNISFEGLVFIAATYYAGLRPSEWLGTRWMDEAVEPVLRVPNAKATNDRAHGPYRRIHFVGARPDQMKPIEFMVNLARECENQDDPAAAWDVIYERARKTVARAAVSIWPRRAQRPTIYSCRHQFGANAKAAGFTREEVAALMGHASDRTASRHYARRVTGHAEDCCVAPNPKDVSRVRETATLWADAQARLSIRGGGEALQDDRKEVFDAIQPVRGRDAPTQDDA